MIKKNPSYMRPAVNKVNKAVNDKCGYVNDRRSRVEIRWLIGFGGIHDGYGGIISLDLKAIEFSGDKTTSLHLIKFTKKSYY